MSLIGQLYVADDPAIALDGLIEPLTLNREGAIVIVRHAVDEENGMLDLVSKHKWRDFQIHFRRFPQGTTFALKTKWRQGTVIGATAGHTSFKQIGMRKQVGGHKSPIAVSTHPN